MLNEFVGSAGENERRARQATESLIPPGTAGENEQGQLTRLGLNTTRNSDSWFTLPIWGNVNRQDRIGWENGTTWHKVVDLVNV